MRAKETPVTDMIEVELCPGCSLRERHHTEPRYIKKGGATVPGSGTELFVISDHTLTATYVSGVKRVPELIEAFEDCKEPVISRSLGSEEVICGAIVALDRKKNA